MCITHHLKNHTKKWCVIRTLRLAMMKMKEIKPNDSHKKSYYYNPNATMKEVFKNIQIHLPKDYKFDREFANSK